jgi:hypothetical protein
MKRLHTIAHLMCKIIILWPEKKLISACSYLRSYDKYEFTATAHSNTHMFIIIQSTQSWYKQIIRVSAYYIHHQVHRAFTITLHFICYTSLHYRSQQTRVRSLGRWDRGFKSHLRYGCLVCVRFYCVFVLSCV